MTMRLMGRGTCSLRNGDGMSFPFVLVTSGRFQDFTKWEAASDD